ncbi:hypothetical protein CKY47_31065 [Saccharothrix yanglingensis]|uniref:Uncharacterized protein n=1 Tax=Saccharothrix yanglingensis TaxID=659496 RepID=A0ABU0X863_9PSEU|nr:hypothetical protein [Saccharothrix yanglingensis]
MQAAQCRPGRCRDTRRTALPTGAGSARRPPDHRLSRGAREAVFPAPGRGPAPRVPRPGADTRWEQRPATRPCPDPAPSPQPPHG